MMSSVPQFIDVEDKIAGPLTWKQLGWMIGMGAIILTFFGLFETTLAIVLSIPIALLFLALAFYKPNGIPMISFIGHATLFLFRPKVAIWERPTPPMVEVEKPAPQAVPEVPGSKRLTPDKLRELAQMIDRRE